MQISAQPMPLSPEVIDDRVATVLEAGTNVTLDYDDASNTLTINATPGGVTSYTDEQAQDAVGNIVADSATIDFLYNDAAPSISGFVKDNSITEPMLSLTDNTTQDATVSKHGLLPKLSGNTTTFLRGDGTWVVPPTGTSYTDEQAQDAVGTILADTSTIDFTYNDTSNQIIADVKDASITESKLSVNDVTTHNVSTIRHGFVPKAPNNATQYLDGTGAWSTPAVTGEGMSSSYDLGITWSGTIPSNQVILRYPFPRPVDFPAGFTNSNAIATIAATASTVFNIAKNGSNIGTITFGAGGTVGTFSVALATSFAMDDVITITAPASADSTLANLGIALAGTRGVSNGEMGATTFLALTDTPDAYIGNALKILRSNAAANAVEFGPVLGTMAEQNANNVDISGGKISIGGHASTSVLDVQNSVQASDAAGFYMGVRVWPVAPSGASSVQPLRVDAMTGVAAGTANFAGVLISDQPATSGTLYGLQSLINAGTGRFNFFANGMAPNYFAGNVGIGTTTPSYPLDVASNARIAGRLGVNAAPASDRIIYILYDKNTQYGILLAQTNDTGGATPLLFQNAATVIIGSVSTTASTTSYNTSSDIRLKHAVEILTGALDVILALNPVRFKWNADDSPGEGFLAHEIQQVIPLAVTGEPDELNADGSIKPQQVDHSKLVPWLVGAIKELSAQVATLTTRITELETALGV